MAFGATPTLAQDQSGLMFAWFWQSWKGRLEVFMNSRIRVTVWNEFRHEQRNPKVQEHYPQGIHAVIAGALAGRTSTSGPLPSTSPNTV
ncbi:hypothetical protein ACFSC4_21625 [Deinococcus malanensis]|uniref:hypothetical protein n=1 Tax=Deinococcus malanensis TaxID=1706855 RepID=UPI0036298455